MDTDGDYAKVNFKISFFFKTNIILNVVTFNLIDQRMKEEEEG